VAGLFSVEENEHVAHFLESVPLTDFGGFLLYSATR